jgi:hypothetical protein
MGAAGSVVAFGEAGMGVWGKTWNRAVILRGRGGSGFSPVHFPIGHPSSVCSCSRASVFPTSLSCLVEGVRSGTRRRPALTSSALVKGCTGTGPGRTAPVPAGTVFVPPLCGLSAAVAFLCAVLRSVRGRPADGIVAERGPAAQLVVLVGVVEGPPPVPRRYRQLAGALVLPEPGAPPRSARPGAAATGRCRRTGPGSAARTGRPGPSAAGSPGRQPSDA